MNIVFVSNYFSHHQRPLSDALAERAEYAFIATAPMTEERRAMGWGGENEPDYVCHYDREPERAEQLLRRADAVIAGSAPERLIRSCIRRNQLVLRYSERPLKNGSEWGKYLPRLVKWHLRNPLGKPIYLLCASAYAAADYARFGLFRGRAFRWGYFPETKVYEDLELLFRRKRKGSILWAGRFLDLKHPEDAVLAAARLKAEGLDFDLNIIGRGEMEEQLRCLIEAEKLQDCVHLLGSMFPEEVRRHMEQSEIFLFTSDRKEGWGAVVNEAMNSGCAVVASDGAGSVPYLIRNGENGLIYASGNEDMLQAHLLHLLTEPAEAARLGRNAYGTISHGWNAETAAERLTHLIRSVVSEADVQKLYADGPCSPAPLIGEE